MSLNGTSRKYDHDWLAADNQTLNASFKGRTLIKPIEAGHRAYAATANLDA
jgi:hypothetical protein